MLEKMPGDVWQKHATLRALYGYMFAHPGKKLMFMGCEFGQWREWNHDESLDWHLLQDPMHEGLQRWVQDLNHTYQRERSLHEIDFEGSGFSWIDCNDNENSVISAIRRARNHTDFTVIAANFTPVPRQDYRIGVPEGGWYRELLNSDAAMYGGGNVGNGGGIMAQPDPRHGHDYSISIALPPLGFVLLKRG
jgi:1,4-alpha-glucan branching enzyme